jgi:hypothetical protein
VTKIGHFIVDFLREFEVILKKALTRVSGPLGELLDEKKPRSKIPCQGPFKPVLWIRIRKNPKVLAGSESEKSSDSDTDSDPDTVVE